MNDNGKLYAHWKPNKVRPCPRCGRDSLNSAGHLCSPCEHELEILEDELEHAGLDDYAGSEYNERLADGFAMIIAAERPYEYNERWS